MNLLNESILQICRALGVERTLLEETAIEVCEALDLLPVTESCRKLEPILLSLLQRAYGLSVPALKVLLARLEPQSSGLSPSLQRMEDLQLSDLLSTEAQSPCEHRWGGKNISFPAEMLSSGQTSSRRIYLEYCSSCGVLRLSHVCRA